MSRGRLSSEYEVQVDVSCGVTPGVVATDGLARGNPAGSPPDNTPFGNTPEANAVPEDIAPGGNIPEGVARTDPAVLAPVNIPPDGTAFGVPPEAVVAPVPPEAHVAPVPLGEVPKKNLPEGHRRSGGACPRTAEIVLRNADVIRNHCIL